MFELLTVAVLLAPVLGTDRTFPFQAALIIDASASCSGVIIAPNFVLTAARCVTGATEVDVIVGTSDIRVHADEVAKISTTIIVHEDYNSVTHENDIALVKLPISLNFDNKISSIAIHAALTSEEHCFVVTGWSGVVNGTKKLIGELSYKEITVTEECRNLVGPALTQGICTCTITEHIEDFGSPLVISGTSLSLIGLLSFVHDELLVFLPVVQYSDWINNKIATN